MELFTLQSGQESVQVLQPSENGVFTRVLRVEANAKLTVIDLQIGNGGTERKTDVLVELVGERAEVKLLGLFAGRGSDNLKISHKVIHAAPRTTSRLESKGILTDASFAHQISRIEILPNQPGCSGDERSDTILLSDHARVIAVPELEIGNNDVQCKHAVTTTRLNKEKIFYLASRGLDEQTARKLLIEAHLSSIVEHVPSEVYSTLKLDLDFL